MSSGSGAEGVKDACRSALLAGGAARVLPDPPATSWAMKPPLDVRSLDPRSSALRWLPSLLLAVAVSMLIAASAGFEWSVRLAGACAFLLVAVEQDVRRSRIPNWLTLPSLAVAVLHGFASAGWGGGGQALLGALLVFGVLLLPFALGGIGAGDAKALMALAALTGPAAGIGILCWSHLIAGILALLLLTLRGGLVEMLRRWLASLGATLATGRLTYLPAPEGVPARSGLPFAVPMGLAVAALEGFGLPWEMLI